MFLGGFVCVPVVSCVSQGAVAGDAFALSLVEGVQGVRVVARLPASSAQVTPLIKTFQHVLPLCIRDLSIHQSETKNVNQQVRSFLSIDFQISWAVLVDLFVSGLGLLLAGLSFPYFASLNTHTPVVFLCKSTHCGVYSRTLLQVSHTSAHWDTPLFLSVEKSSSLIPFTLQICPSSFLYPDLQLILC